MIKTRKKYLTNKDLHKELEISNKNNEATEKLHLMFYELAKRIATKPCFSSYQIIEEMINDAYVKCITNFKKFNINKRNPFAYFTSVVNNTFIDCIYIENKNKTIKELSKEKFILNMYLKHGITYKSYFK